jgi:hypothetical protein
LALRCLDSSKPAGGREIGEGISKIAATVMAKIMGEEGELCGRTLTAGYGDSNFVYIATSAE